MTRWVLATAAVLVLVAGLAFSPTLGWQNTYYVMVDLLLGGAGATMWGPEPRVDVPPPGTLQEAVWVAREGF